MEERVGMCECGLYIEWTLWHRLIRTLNAFCIGLLGILLSKIKELNLTPKKSGGKLMQEVV